MKFLFRRGWRRNERAAVDHPSPPEKRSGEWMPRLAGILLSVLSMHLLVVRPLLARLDRLREEQHAVDQTLTELSDSGTCLWETNQFLKGLRLQRDELAAARATLQQWRRLHDELHESIVQNRQQTMSAPRGDEHSRETTTLRRLPYSPELRSLSEPASEGWRIDVQPMGTQPRQVIRFRPSEPATPETTIPVTLADWFASADSQQR